MSIGQRIKAARELKDLTLDDVAKKCATTKQTIFKYENEIIVNIPYEKILLLSRALDVTPSYLFGWDEGNSPTELKFSEGEMRLIELFRKVSKDRQELVLQMIEAALKTL